MSNQFSYELDERQIRLLMLNSESNYNEAAWQRFETTISSSYKPMSKASLPKINFSISRSVIIPVLFIGLIGGLSILLFSFVDIKKKEELVIEKPLQITKPVVKPKTIAVKTIVKPKVTTAPIISTPVINTPVEKSSPVKPTTESKVVLEASAKDFKAAEITKKVEVSSIQNTSTNSVKTVTSKPKKKKKQIVVEELPTITTPANLTTTSEEPELDLK